MRVILQSRSRGAKVRLKAYVRRSEHMPFYGHEFIIGNRKNRPYGKPQWISSAEAYRHRSIWYHNRTAVALIGNTPWRILVD
jgi:hypothetical protein